MAIKDDYMKQRRRIQRAISRMEKGGYILPENVLPPIPKRITRASVRRLEKITTDVLYKKSRYVDIETGEIISGIVARDRKRSEAAKKAAETRRRNKKYKPLEQDIGPMRPDKVERDTPYDEPYVPYDEPYVPYDEPYVPYDELPRQEDIIITNFIETIEHFPEVAEPLLREWLNELLRDYSRCDVAEMLERAAADGIGVDYTVAYDADLLIDRIAEIQDYLPGASRGNLNKIIEHLEEWEHWKDYDD